ncbi:pyridoxal phosphate-dependent aminotransferase [Pseudomonas sp. GX19020]|uniref:MalY/PatB family protein n=1 Tax=Pseudomonas sp. GX19020 TaxID=2942277 RepID=UPI002019CDDA|nr:MalY/PatB family protein [Pseudomonas sp. GX19020]MCL4066467.1 pyridoxal phosphate-dependent aminotransferase [Pseudomonas sp. GX19020]
MTRSDFDTPINRFGSHCVKWDMMETLYGIPHDRGLAMWVADMEFRPPAAVQTALQNMLDHGIYGYFGDERPYLEALTWWMETRHGWKPDPSHIFTTHGLVNAVGLCLQAFTQPGDGVVLMTPVYHAFARTIRASGREVVECALNNNAGRYELDIAAWDAQLTGRETMLILCSPHNPGGRVWTASELREIADFARRHDLILVSDEIHFDLTYPGQRHIVMPNAAPDITDRLVMLTATTKTFNIAGAHIGNVIIADEGLRRKFAAVMSAIGISPNSFGMHMVTAACSPEGAAWVDALMTYLDGNRQLFDAAVNAIPGLKSMPLEATYLSWVDFSGTGLSKAEMLARVETQAAIATNHGDSFGKGGESFIRFNIAAPRAQIEEAIARLQGVFADLQ